MTARGVTVELRRALPVELLTVIAWPERVVSFGFGELRDLERQFMATLTMVRGAFDAFAPVVERAQQLGALIDRLGPALDDLSELLVAARQIAESAERIAESAQGIDGSAAIIARDAEVLARDAARLARFTDRIPGGGKRQA
ncbi:hypothetical protein FK531_08140 [Rhodococcus spelaei]|uniref:Uncharacterized protein n=1 Tax=Rhodococcus spelaei TaxID=2546320 RepID=A0A541BMB4_9NOCA|nr:hypothetical protein [Rhodococcus spelaei]TQF73455.1 hypothetical protein FK531_08140 [Rhodococcus spelaei]